MSRQRPGGLTALAVLNFVFGGFKILGFILSAVQLANLAQVKKDAAAMNIELPPDWFFLYGVLTSAIIGALLILSGVGYLKLRKKLGRGLGNMYAVLSLVDTGVQIAVGEFSMVAILFSIYPVLTLFALNIIFKDDFE